MRGRMVRLSTSEAERMGFTGRLATQGVGTCQIGTHPESLALTQRFRSGGAGSPTSDPRSVVSLASVGLLGLASLPILMLASIAANAPLAGPAVISLGYIAAAHALAGGQDGRALRWMVAVFAALVAWSALLPLFGDISPDSGGLIAALLAPLLAAAPALTRKMIPGGPRPPSRPNTGVPGRNEVTRPPETNRGRLDESAMSGRTSDESGRIAFASRQPVPPSDASDLLDAVGFGLRHVGPRARSKAIRLICSTESDLAVAADRQVCRRLACALLAEAVRASPIGAAVQISGRRLKGAILLRVLCAREADQEGLPTKSRFDVTAIRAMVEPLGGTVLPSRSAEGESLSLRLAPAALGVRQAPREPGSGAF
jgi:hypothetical protein